MPMTSPLLPRPANLPILSNDTGGSVECIGQRQVGYRLENGEPFVATWHVANVTNLIISAVSLTGANIEVTHAKNESSLIMDRCGTQISVMLHKFAQVSWLKLRRDNSVMDSDLKIAAVNTKPMAIEEIDSDEDRRTRLRRKKEALGMDDTVEVLLTQGMRHVVPEIVSRTQLKHRWRSEQHLIRCCGVMSLVDYSNQLRRREKPKERASQFCPNPAAKATHELTHTSFHNWCSCCVRARTAGDPHHRQPHKDPEFPIIMADYCFM